MNKTTLLSLVTTTAIISAVHAGDSDWDNSFDLGATVTSGNTDTSLITLGYTTTKKGAKNEYFGDATYTYGDSESETTSNQFLGSFSWNQLVSDRTYTGLRFDLRADELADIDYRAGLTGLVGYYFLKNDSTYFALETGLGYTAEQTGDGSDTYANLYFGDRFEHKFNEKTRIYQTLSITTPVDDIEDFSLVTEVGLETALSDELSLKIYIQDKYENLAPGGVDNNDLKFVTGISYKF